MKLTRASFLVVIAYSFVLAAVPGADLWWWLGGIYAWVIVIAAEMMFMSDGSLKDALTPSWRSDAFVVVLVVYSCSAISIPGGYNGRPFIAYGLWFLVGIVWLGRFLVLVALERGRLWKLRWPALLVQPGLALLFAILALTQAPFWANYLLSRNAMTSEARAVLRGKGLEKIHKIGHFPVDGGERYGRTVRFAMSGTGYDFSDESQFVYSPGGKPRLWASSGKYRHLTGPWYTWAPIGID